ncbi:MULTISPECIES: efflux RND transporter periplasmic adaptor subunit [Paraburkholderia]|uniref:Efflux RND transporter periplasmic adaptor subunit n=1 Tax=Paraburkholderia madseniana TaxID=2599607 RepID=A0AAP5BPX0_9BURK|nr:MULTISPECIES: efflux RND transporter periplasmic adaptor subunit [Paraburkholderia]MCX4152013.1 efflux RND transporter periplasmic adaptor subunit [Paraburkholderia madseniana]MDN7154941.1 efflux RND transporter periplasmic adaptor subunit [Paraburkholderia sp. WS6]MDQ6413824.1 efflux RND transporter periplasmic adaptor subunit [Paraburkholderia madseniana]
MRNSPLAARRPRIATYATSLACAALMSIGAQAAGAASASAGDDAADQAVVSVQTARVQRAVIAQPVRAYGIVAASASNLTTVNLPYLARIVQMRVQAGQSVTRGTPLFVVQADPAAVLAATQAKSAVTLAQGELARTQSLYDKGLATQSQLATARKAAEDAQQALAAQNQTGVAGGNKIIAAPIDGVVLQVSAAQGDQVQPGAAILQLAGGNGKDARANVMLGVEPSDIPAIHAGDTVTLHGLSTTLAKTAADGHVVLVGASVDQQSQLVNVGANVPLGQSAFIPGTRVSADIATRSGTHWVVPRAAVLKDDKGAYVFQITPQNKARRVAVVTQVENGDRYGVDGPIDGAEGLVVSGNYELKDGMAVRAAGGAPR